MAPPKAPRKIAASSELGLGDWAITHNARTGRPQRKPRTKAESPFVDSAIAITDEEDSESEVETVPKVRKRKRSPSPPLTEVNDVPDSPPSMDDDVREDETMGVRSTRRPRLPLAADSASSGMMRFTLKEVTINVPAGHQGPIVLHLDPGSLTHSSSPQKPLKKPRLARKKSSPPSTRGRTKHTTKSVQTSAGFLDLPPELRNEIYRLVFVRDTRLDFANPTNFTLSAAFLRTCTQIHAEGRSILYSENSFLFTRRASRYGSLWSNDWSELGYRPVRHFLKTIGTLNTSLIRHVLFQFEDATPCLNPDTMSHEDRRFVHDDVLMSVLRHLGDYAQLQSLRLNFHGRRRVEMNDQRILGYLRGIRADRMELVRYPIGRGGGESYWSQESKQEEAVGRMLGKVMVRKCKLFD